jgi:hypothetical protein
MFWMVMVGPAAAGGGDGDGAGAGAGDGDAAGDGEGAGSLDESDPPHAAIATRAAANWSTRSIWGLP